jgi:hypothetical protein
VESVTITPPYYSGIFCNRETGSGTYGLATANKIWMSRKFFPLPGIFSTKNRKSLPKNFTKKLRQVRSQFVIGSVDPALLTCLHVRFSPIQETCRPQCRTSGLLPLAVMLARPTNVRFTPKVDIG